MRGETWRFTANTNGHSVKGGVIHTWYKYVLVSRLFATGCYVQHRVRHGHNLTLPVLRGARAVVADRSMVGGGNTNVTNHRLERFVFIPRDPEGAKRFSKELHTTFVREYNPCFRLECEHIHTYEALFVSPTRVLFHRNVFLESLAPIVRESELENVVEYRRAEGMTADDPHFARYIHVVPLYCCSAGMRQPTIPEL